jgi:hypothetical protein
MVSKDKWIISSVLSIGISLCLPLTLLGAEKFIAVPKIAAGWQVDSNYFLSENNEREVVTYLIQPGTEVGYETTKSEVLLDFNLNFFFYDDRDSVPAGEPKASDDNYVGYNLNFMAVTEPNDRLVVGLRNRSFLSRNPTRVDTLGNFTGRDKYVQNFFRPRLHYDLTGRLALDIGYENRLLHWLDGPNDDLLENRGLAALIYSLRRTLQVGLQYQLWRTQFDGDTSDYTSNQLGLLFEKQFHHISLLAGGGYQDRSFDDSEIDDISTPAYVGAVRGQWPAPSTATKRQRLEARAATRRLWLTAPAGARSYFELMFDQNFNDTGLGTQFYVARRLRLIAGRTFAKKIVTRVDGWFQNSDFKKSDREDDTYRLYGSIGYRFLRWLTFSVGGGYESRDSNIDGEDFDNAFFRAHVDAKWRF